MQPNRDIKSINPSSILLPYDRNFLVTRSGNEYSKTINITHRSPRMLADTRLLVTTTTTVDAGTLNNLRLEYIDKQYFVINDSKNSLSDPVRLTVESEEVGHQIIKAIVSEFSSEDTYAERELGISKRYLRCNGIIEKLSAIIVAGCAVTLSISGSIHLLFR